MRSPGPRPTRCCGLCGQCRRSERKGPNVPPKLWENAEYLQVRCISNACHVPCQSARHTATYPRASSCGPRTRPWTTRLAGTAGCRRTAVGAARHGSVGKLGRQGWPSHRGGRAAEEGRWRGGRCQMAMVAAVLPRQEAEDLTPSGGAPQAPLVALSYDRPTAALPLLPLPLLPLLLWALPGAHSSFTPGQPTHRVLVAPQQRGGVWQARRPQARAAFVWQGRNQAKRERRECVL
jgi:hypothetical protein